MNKHRYHLMSCAVLLSILALSFPSLNYSQESNNQTDLSIRLKVTDSRGRSVEGIVTDGEMLTRVDAKSGLGYGFTPFVQDRNTGLVQVKMSRIAKNEGQAEVLEEIGSASIKPGEVRQLGDPSYTIQVVAIMEDVKESSVAGESAIALASAECCVTCDGERTCGTCGVLTDCGCCCVGGRCCGACR